MTTQTDLFHLAGQGFPASHEYAQKPPAPTPLEVGHQAAQAAGARADREVHEWMARAVALFARYAVAHPGGFTTENVRMSAADFPDAPDGRAWGAVALQARREGYVKAAGYAPATSSNGSPKTLWIPA